MRDSLPASGVAWQVGDFWLLAGHSQAGAPVRLVDGSPGVENALTGISERE
jgi:hypothetical protein